MEEGEAEGVVINGIRWATRNVDAPGTFAANPEDAGMFYQWNTRVGWSATYPDEGVPIENWNDTPNEDIKWRRANDPCPQGWRVPTIEELLSLRNTNNVWTTRNGVYGRYFGTYPHRIFMPAVGWRFVSDGSLEHAGGEEGGVYWSSTPDANTGLSWSIGETYIPCFGNPSNPTWGFSFRCVAE